MMQRLSLSSQFLVVAAVVLLSSTILLGAWVEHRITRSVLATHGADASTLMHGLVEPLVQNLLPDGTLPPESHQALDALFVGTPLADKLVSVKIWRKDQVVLYSSLDKRVIGQRFASSDVVRAFDGEIVSEFQVSGESNGEAALHLPLTEIYAPLHRTGTDEILAVGEFYDDDSELASEVQGSLWRSWAVVFLTSVLTLAILYAIVRRGASIIAAQGTELRHRIDDAERMAEQNSGLRAVAEKARLDASEANEELIGRIGLDLHDGPIQLLTLLMLRLGELKTTSRGRKPGWEQSLTSIRELTANVIQELRTLSTGLVLPEIGELSMRGTITLAIDRHENLTGTKVERCLGALPQDASDALKICLYRIVQESLTNSFRHAGGVGQKVEANQVEGAIEVAVSDAGGGLQRTNHLIRPGSLGLRGISNRVQALGGSVEITTDGPTGMRVSVSMPVSFLYSGGG